MGLTGQFSCPANGFCQDLIDGKHGDNVDASVYERVEMFHTDSVRPTVSNDSRCGGLAMSAMFSQSGAVEAAAVKLTHSRLGVSTPNQQRRSKHADAQA